jgi:hypothetical protein
MPQRGKCGPPSEVAGYRLPSNPVYIPPMPDASPYTNEERGLGKAGEAIRGRHFPSSRSARAAGQGKFVLPYRFWSCAQAFTIPDRRNPPKIRAKMRDTVLDASISGIAILHRTG